MAEIVTLAVPVDPPKTIFRIARLDFDWWHARIEIHLRDWTGTAFGDRLLVAEYTGDEAIMLMMQLNKVNLSTAGNSLHQRVMARLTADGKIPAGTASGNPD